MTIRYLYILVLGSQLHLIELEKAHKELQQASVTAMQHAVLDERTRIAREIHDAIGHSLTSLIVQLQALRYMIEADPAQAKHSVEEMLTVARQGLTDIRISVHALAADQSALGITPLQALVSKVNVTSCLYCTFTAGAQTEEITANLSGGSSLPLKVEGSLLTGTIGLVFLISALMKKPLLLILARSFDNIDSQRFSTPVNRKKITIITALLGFVFLAEAAARVDMALTLPTGTFIVMSNVLKYAMYAVLALFIGVRLMRQRHKFS